MLLDSCHISPYFLAMIKPSWFSFPKNEMILDSWDLFLRFFSILSLGVTHSWRPQIGRKGRKKILTNLADSCVWFLGKWSSDPYGIHMDNNQISFFLNI